MGRDMSSAEVPLEELAALLHTPTLLRTIPVPGRGVPAKSGCEN